LQRFAENSIPSLEAIEAEMARRGLTSGGVWPEFYTNVDTGKPYKPHHDDEEKFVYSDRPRYVLAKGGEGGGKSVAGIVKDLNRLKRGMTGIMGSSDLQHFKKSLWPEFRRWCPVSALIDAQRYRLNPSWEPQQMFTLTFTSGAQLICGGFDDPSGWEGPNVSFAHWDEARRHKTAAMLKVLDGRCRIPGPAGEPPQIWLTTTPAKHWLFDYFGPLLEEDPFAAFKADAFVVSLLTRDNEAAGNLSEGFTRQRAQSLTESEARVLLEAEWEDVDDVSRFLQSILWWDVCREELPTLDRNTPIVLAADAGVTSDCFGVVGVSAHPAVPEQLAARLARKWQPQPGKPLNFDEIEEEIKQICLTLNVLKLVYDPYQLHQMMTGLKGKSKTEDGRDFPGVQTEEFGQGAERAQADKNLLDLIKQRRLAHDGDPDLRKHLDNADKKTAEDRKLRLVKRSDGLKIDLAVCLSMAAYRAPGILGEIIPTVPAAGMTGRSTWRNG
jgi:hypothetical protein